MFLLTIEALIGLAVFDALRLARFQWVYTCARRCPVVRRTPPSGAEARVCRAVNEASIWYPKRAFCLQRSIVASWLLRLHGIPATVVIGFRPVPMESHAWVEVGGVVVNDRPQYQKFFRELDRL